MPGPAPPAARPHSRSGRAVASLGPLATTPDRVAPRRATPPPAGAKNIKLKPEVDADLIGGFIVQFGKGGSGLIDMSVRGQLAKLRAQLETSAA